MPPLKIEFSSHVTLSLFRDAAHKIVDQMLERLDPLASTLMIVPTHPFGDQRHVIPLDCRVDDGITRCGAWYSIEKPPSWLREDLSPNAADPVPSPGPNPAPPLTAKILDVANHLAVLLVYHNYLAVYEDHINEIRDALAKALQLLRNALVDRVVKSSAAVSGNPLLFQKEYEYVIRYFVAQIEEQYGLKVRLAPLDLFLVRSKADQSTSMVVESLHDEIKVKPQRRERADSEEERRRLSEQIAQARKS